MKYFLLSILLLTACSNIPHTLPDIENEAVALISEPTLDGSSPNAVSYYDQPLSNNVNDYAQWLIQDLFTNIDIPQNSTTFMVTDLAILDSDLNKTNLFGRQMSEAILHEVHQTGFSTFDIRTTGFVRMTEQGDIFSQSRDYTELDANLAATNIITGTFTRHRGGYLLNARAIDLNSKVLIASAQIFIPHNVVDSVMHEEMAPRIETNKIIETDAKLVSDANKNKRVVPLKKYVSRP